jgi:hypothetical protein
MALAESGLAQQVQVNSFDTEMGELQLAILTRPGVQQL